MIKLSDFQVKKKIAHLLRHPDSKFKDLAEFCFRDTKTQLKILLAEHHLRMHNFIDRAHSRGYANVAIEAHIESGKTQTIAVQRASREVGRDKNIRIRICSANDGIAVLRVGAIGSIIKYNENFKLVYPEIKPSSKWGESAFRVEGTPIESTDYTVQGAGVNSSVLGGGCDLLIFDDPCDLKNSLNAHVRKKTILMIRQMWLSRVRRGGRVWWIGTPMHREDAMKIITKQWQRLSMPVKEDLTCMEVYENDLKVDEIPLWSLKSAQMMKDYKREFGSANFNANFRLIPFSEELSLFQHFNQCVRYNIDPRTLKFKAMYGGVDLSSKTRAGTVLILVGITMDNVKVPVEVVYIDDPIKVERVLVRWKAEYSKEKYGTDLIRFLHVENNSMQDVLVDILKGKRILPIREFLTGRNKADPYVGLQSMDVEFENGYWQICVPHSKDDECNCPFCKLVDSMSIYPNGMQTDDVMAFWFAREACRWDYKKPAPPYVETERLESAGILQGY